ncbi:hypothetical protein PABG_12350 [Paracoccidioides brasiliensis Pb03]|nr:hypothetical protein PABG_12350 [Paracoccidioides brasiliensis Pb03]
MARNRPEHLKSLEMMPGHLSSLIAIEALTNNEPGAMGHGPQTRRWKSSNFHSSWKRSQSDDMKLDPVRESLHQTLGVRIRLAQGPGRTGVQRTIYLEHGEITRRYLSWGIFRTRWSSDAFDPLFSGSTGGVSKPLLVRESVRATRGKQAVTIDGDPLS